MNQSSNDLNLENAIAVIGMSCRFPNADTPEKYWQLLRDGVDCAVAITEEDLITAGLNPEIRRHPNYVGRQVVLDDVDAFDAAFFGYFPRDAEILDPQQRLMLECAWKALESAGYVPGKFEGMIGIYAGTDMSQYLFNLYANREIMESVGMFQINLANDKDHVTTRVAYKLNLNGPAVTIQTTCSTSLVAICQACQSLLNYQCDIALAGGTAISLPQRIGYVYQEGGIASPDGYCRTFDARAQGTIGGSGTGVVVLKRLVEALEDRDHIHAVIRGFAINNDGAGKVGYTAPSVEGQSEVIAMAQAMAEVNPDTISYIEAHGTATPLGDPIEVRALTEVFRSSTNRKTYCGIGSVKSNFGHLNSAAGVAGFSKVVLALKNKLLPPSLHFETPNPNIDFANSPFYVVKELKAWETNGVPRRAGISSFGIGGTNAHVILEEAPPASPGSASRPWQLLVFSARSLPALDELVRAFGAYLAVSTDLNLPDVVYTLQLGRKDFEHRMYLLVKNDEIAQVAGKLQPSDLHHHSLVDSDEEEKSVVFMFSGQGSQHVGMAQNLYKSEVFFREQVDGCCAIIADDLGIDLRTLLFPEPGGEAAAGELLTQTRYTQPALFIIEYALAKLWMHWGVRPTAMVGHSIGEYVAACLAGVFTPEDALKIVVERGRLMQSVTAGVMLSVPLPEAEVLKILDPALSVAVINSPELTVVSGPSEAIAPFRSKLEAQGHSCRLLNTSHAFHSSMFDPIIGQFAGFVGSFARSRPEIPFVSNKSGAWIADEEATNPNYWAMHLRQAVRFSENIETLAAGDAQVFLEVGPGNTLQKLAQQILSGNSKVLVVASLPHSKDPTPDDKHLLNTLGQLWLQGIHPDWAGFYSEEKRYRVALPTYPFEKTRFWISPSKLPGEGVGENGAAAKKREMDQWFYLPEWEKDTTVDRIPDTGAAGQKWLVFSDAIGYSRPFLAYIESIPDSQLITVKAGSAFRAEEDPHTYTLHPASREDYRTLLHTLRDRDQLPDIVLHFWNIDLLGEETTGNVGNIKYSGFFSLLFLAQQLTEISPGRHCSFSIFTKELYRLTKTDRIDPVQALSVGAGKVINQELPNLLFQNIDLNGSLTENDAHQKIIRSILAGLDKPVKDQITAWRSGGRWKLNYKQASVREINRLKLRLRPGGVYLITGGLGGIGLVIAKYLAIRKRANLLLLSRKKMPPRSEWEVYLQNHAASQDRMVRMIRDIKDLEGFGARVYPVSADVTDRTGIQALAETIEAQFGRLHGIVHSAGVPGGGIVPLKTEKEALAVMAPKVEGTLILQEIFGKRDLDFFILCSSLSAILGGMGQIDYCAANSFQDAFAQRFRDSSTYYLSINWDTWGETGMAVNTQVPDDMKRWQEEGLKRGIKNLEGMKLFEHLIASDQPQIATSTTNLLARFQPTEHAAPTAPRPAQETRTPERSTARHKRPDLTTPYQAAGNVTEEKIIFIWQELLGISPIGIHDNFLELGGHSLLAVQLISRLRDFFGIEITIQDFFERPTVAAIAKYVAPKEQPAEVKVEAAIEKRSNPNTISRVSRANYRVKLDEDGIEDIPDSFKQSPDEE